MVKRYAQLTSYDPGFDTSLCDVSSKIMFFIFTLHDRKKVVAALEWAVDLFREGIQVIFATKYSECRVVLNIRPRRPPIKSGGS